MGKTEKGKLSVAVIGLGYVGLPLAVEFAKKGVKTFGVEVSEGKTKLLKRGKSYIPDISSAEIKETLSAGNFIPTGDFSRIKDAGAVIICVPTPLRKTKDPDISYIISAAERISRHLRKGHTVILESTTYPGTTREVLLPILEKSGLKAGKDFGLAFSPERVDPGNKVYGIGNTPKVVGGIDRKSAETAASLYGKVAEKVVKVSSLETAEIVKLLENTFRAVNIAMINEFALMAGKLGLDIWEVIEAAATKPFGFMPFYPGPGIGGHCIPLDPHYLAWKMKTLNFNPRFIELADAVNSFMPEYAVSKIAEALNEKGKPLKGSKILIVGIAYKPDITDDRESPAKDIFSLLAAKKAVVRYHDPLVPVTEVSGRKIRSSPISPKALGKYDCVAVITPHSFLDYGKILRFSKLVFDARNILRSKSAKVRKL